MACGSMIWFDLQAYAVHIVDRKLKNNTILNFV